MSVYIVKCKKTYLKSPLTAAASSVVLRELKTSKDANVALADFGEFGVIVIKQGDNIEMIKFNAVSIAADGTATLTVASSGRHLNPTQPYAGSSTGLAFQSGAEVIVTNDPLTSSTFFLNNANTWDEVQTFTSLPKTNAGNPVANEDLARKAYVDSVVAGIASTINVIVAGNAGETVAAGNLLYLDSADSEWKKCDADTAATVENVILGIAQGAGTDGVAISGGILISGRDANQSGLTANSVYYASNTAGGISSSAGTKEVTVGIAISTTALIFMPRYNQQLTEDQQDALAGSSGTPSNTNKYITADDVSDAAVSGKIVRATGTALPALSGTNLTGIPVTRFGGTGADGALSASSGTTTLSFASARVLVKNYTSISLTGTAVLDCSNPHDAGSTLILRSQGAVTITSSTNPAVDLRSMGGAAGAAVTGESGDNHQGNDGNGSGGGFGGFFNTAAAQDSGGAGGGGGGGITIGSVGGSGDGVVVFAGRGGKAVKELSAAVLFAEPGGGGASGTSGNSAAGTGGAGGAGGRGGGGLVIECAGALNITSVFNVAGAAGSAGASSADGNGGGGGGGAGGSILILYATLTANTATFTVTAGAAGAGGADGGGGTAGAGGAGSAGQSLVAANTFFN